MTYATHASKDVARRPVSLVAIGSLDIARILFAAIALLCPGCRRDPPDLTACTRIDIHYTAGALDHLFPSTSMQEELLNEIERENVRSYDTWTVTDLELIKAFAHRISQGEYRGRQFGVIDDTPVDITCYQGSDRVASFAVHRRSIVTENRRKFAYPPELLILRNLDPPGLKRLKARWECAANLGRLAFEGLWPGRGRRAYPDPNHWCDVTVEAYRSQYITRGELSGKKERMYPDSYVATRFTCPGANAGTDGNNAHTRSDETDSSSQPPDSWVLDYAMNSNCTEGSPDNMVFLFESQPGWNQHGRPELFTFDNHDPKGGCVLLNGGTVKFIRTEEELHQLRWK